LISVEKNRREKVLFGANRERILVKYRQTRGETGKKSSMKPHAFGKRGGTKGGEESLGPNR